MEDVLHFVNCFSYNVAGWWSSVKIFCWSCGGGGDSGTPVGFSSFFWNHFCEMCLCCNSCFFILCIAALFWGGSSKRSAAPDLLDKKTPPLRARNITQMKRGVDDLSWRWFGLFSCFCTKLFLPGRQGTERQKTAFGNSFSWWCFGQENKKGLSWPFFRTGYLMLLLVGFFFLGRKLKDVLFYFSKRREGDLRALFSNEIERENKIATIRSLPLFLWLHSPFFTQQQITLSLFPPHPDFNDFFGLLFIWMSVFFSLLLLIHLQSFQLLPNCNVLCTMMRLFCSFFVLCFFSWVFFF